MAAAAAALPGKKRSGKHLFLRKVSSRRTPRETERSLYLLIFAFRSCYFGSGFGEAKSFVFGLARPTRKGVLGAVAQVLFLLFFFSFLLLGVLCLLFVLFVWLGTRVTTYGISWWRFVSIFSLGLLSIGDRLQWYMEDGLSGKKGCTDWRSLLLEFGSINMIIVLFIFMLPWLLHPFFLC